MAYEMLTKLYYTNRDSYEQTFQERYQSETAIHIDFPALSPTCFCLQTMEISNMMLQIYKSDKRVFQLREKLPGVAIEQFTRRCLIDEIVLTNSIEGVNSTRRDISTVLDELGKKDEKKRFHGLVQKYYMLQHKENVKLESCADIRNIYNELVLQEVREEDPKDVPDGEIFRKGSVSVYTPSQKEIHRGLYPEAAIQAAAEKALAFLENAQVDLLIRIAVLHYLIGFIHPFYNGNGRLSRFISSYLLAQEMDPLLSYRLSYTVKEHISDYYAAFKECNDPKSHGDITPFVYCFLKIISEATEQLCKGLERRAKQLTYYAAVLDARIPSKDKVISEIGFVLVQAQLFSENGISTKELLQGYQISRVTLQKKLAFFTDLGVLITQKIGREKYYSMDLSSLEELEPYQP